MDKLKIYLDNCCYARPFDDLSQDKIRDEATAKMYIQSLIKFDSLDLFTSFMLLHEINDIPSENNREHILNFVNEYSSLHISKENENEIVTVSE